MLNNQADISIMRPCLLGCLEDAKIEVKLSGVGGVQLSMKKTGYLDNFFHVYASDDTRENVLCFADVKDMYDIMYVLKEGFTVHIPDRDITFQWCGKLYVADFA